MDHLHTSKTLEIARAKASFSVKDMELYINGHKNIQLREKLLKILRAEPELFDMSDIYFMGRKERMEKAYKLDVRAIQLFREGKLEYDEIDALFNMLEWSAPFFVTRAMFIPTLVRQANDAQKEAFLKPALEFKIIGCYAQTELGHGSNVKGIETTARYIEETDEFELNTPTLTSTKWWIGTLGVSATHASVMAQLIIKGKNYGVFPIIVQVRSLVDHSLLPGITVGDIGPKMGLDTIDNGFMQLNKVRVPRFNLLQRYITVEKGGAFSRPNNVNPKVTYGTMVYVRVNIVKNMAQALSKATTIAVRYTSVRRQFGESGKQETPVLDYDIVQYRLLPLVAKNYAIMSATSSVFDQYEKCSSEIENGNFEMLDEMHATSCSLKRYASNIGVFGIDTCRHVCGGHGFSQFSGLNELYSTNYPSMIYEGDNYVLATQIARYMVKSANKIKNNQKIPQNALTTLLGRFINGTKATQADPVKKAKLFNWTNKTGKEIADSHMVMLNLLGYKLYSLTMDLEAKIYGRNQEWSESSVPSQDVATTHAEYLVCLFFGMNITKLPKNSNLRPILNELFTNFALSCLTRNTGELYSLPVDACLTHKQISELEDSYIQSIKRIRDQAVPLVDALGVPDEKLNSSLGRYDGNVYEDYMQRALSEPLNREGTGEEIRSRFFVKYIGPTIHAKRTKSKAERVMRLAEKQKATSGKLVVMDLDEENTKETENNDVMEVEEPKKISLKKNKKSKKTNKSMNKKGVSKKGKRSVWIPQKR
ncbi:hypothetical protein BB559_003616 [Furculomyces boomerangus]|uniref:Acyl-coenzyme A oxidase n=1 Tax=Furculomyces boomerangus TaxID=61424 RepID=A0A2T9YK97_9FUNG|nr:hypothetical protein BB559_003616 [Furculomyces boomerangus]